MAQDPPVRRSSLVFPIALILIGVLFFAANWSRDFDPFHVIWTYWPVLLILLGLGKIYDRTRRQQDPTAAPVSSTGGIVGLLLVLLIFAGIFGHGHGRGFHWRNRDRGWDRDDAQAENFADIQHRSQTIDQQSAKSVHAEINMGAGELNLQGGSTHLLDAQFDFRNTSEPHVDYHVNNGVGELKVSQAGSSNFIGRTENTWHLGLANEVPLTLEVDMGAGQGNLHLRDLNLTKLEMNLGAGQANVDLTGDRKADLQAEVNGGVGEADIRLPKNVGVIVEATGVIGSIDTHGLKHENGHYTNDAYGKSPATIHLEVNGAIGRINLQQE